MRSIIDPVYAVSSCRLRDFLALSMVVSVLSISPIISYIGWRSVYTGAIIGSLVIVVQLSGNLHVSRKFAAVAALLLLTSSVAALRWSDLRYILYPAFFLYSMLLVRSADSKTIAAFIDALTAVLLVVVAGATISFFLVMLGLKPLGSIRNPDGRSNYYFIFTFSNSYFASYMRASGIFDEPGALSFFVCGAAAARHLLHRDNRITWLLLLLGASTLSLAHFLYLLIHFSAERINRRNVLRVIVILFMAVSLIAVTGIGAIVREAVISRIVLGSLSDLSSEPRVDQLTNAVSAVSSRPGTMAFGLGPICAFDSVRCKEQFPLTGANPLSPMVQVGLLVGWPYYFVTVALLVVGLLDRRFIVASGIGILLLQRPYAMHMAYSLCSLVVLRIVYAVSLAQRLRIRRSFAPILH